jgi:hypothetical protein
MKGDFTSLLGLITRTGLSTRISVGPPMILRLDLGGCFITPYSSRKVILYPLTSFNMECGEYKVAVLFVTPAPLGHNKWSM